MPKHATVRLQPLQTCLVNLPLSLYGQLVSRSVTPQSLVVCLSFGGDKGNSAIKASSKSRDGKDDANRVYVGWSGMPSRLVGGVAAIGKGQEALEMDPVCARELGLAEGVEVSFRTCKVSYTKLAECHINRSPLTFCAICLLLALSMWSRLVRMIGK